MIDLLICASAFTLVLLASVVVRFCRRRTSVTERILLAAALLASAAGAVGIVAWERSPKYDSYELVSPELDPAAVEHKAAWYRAEHVAALCGAALLVLGGVLTLVPAVRSAPWFPASQAAWGCLAILMLGYVAGIAVRRQDEAVTRARGERIIGALEHYRSDNGRYPDALSALAPAYLIEIPRPRVGWADQSFAYVSRETRYELIYLSARDVMTWRQPSRYPGWVPRYMLWDP